MSDHMTPADLLKMAEERLTQNLSAFPWSGADSSATVNVTTRRKCRRHAFQVLLSDGRNRCAFCSAIENPTVSHINRNNRKRGNRTSHDLATYLVGRNVEALKEPWDVEACGARIQSKRLAQRPSIAAIVGLIEYIPMDAYKCRALYWVGAGQRVSSGRIFMLEEEWIDEYGWRATPPDGAVVHVGRAYILELPVATFREIRGVG
jgi:hypothetical protein